MRLQDFQTAVQSIPFGKRLPNALYVHRGDAISFDGPLKAIVDRLVELHGVGPDFNVLKFRTDAPRLAGAALQIGS